jgi:hypothetical protein
MSRLVISGNVSTPVIPRPMSCLIRARALPMNARARQIIRLAMEGSPATRMSVRIFIVGINTAARAVLLKFVLTAVQGVFVVVRRVLIPAQSRVALIAARVEVLVQTVLLIVVLMEQRLVLMGIVKIQVMALCFVSIIVSIIARMDVPMGCVSRSAP